LTAHTLIDNALAAAVAHRVLKDITGAPMKTRGGESGEFIM